MSVFDIREPLHVQYVAPRLPPVDALEANYSIMAMP